jgi:uncharacterized protein (DUF1499 family)
MTSPLFLNLTCATEEPYSFFYISTQLYVNLRTSNVEFAKTLISRSKLNKVPMTSVQVKNRYLFRKTTASFFPFFDDLDLLFRKGNVLT